MQKLDFLISLYVFCIAVSELMGGKTFPIADLGFMKLNASIAIFTIPVIFSVNDIIAEVYGRERARSVVRSGLIVVFLIILFSLFATNLPPSQRFATKEQAYDTIFTMSIRFAASSLTAFAIAEFLDVFLFVKIREKLGKGRLWLRNNVSNIISQFVDTTVFITLAFYAFNKPLGDNVSFLVSIILPYWLLKCFMSVIETPFVYLAVRWLKNDKNK